VDVTTIIVLQLLSLYNTQLTFLTKQAQTYKIKRSCDNAMTIKLINNATHCSRNKQQILANMVSSICFKGVEERKLSVFSVICNWKMRLQTKKEYVSTDILPSNSSR